ncbi:MAG: hypothetical protein AAB036_12235 [Elusimicrobiota bacterium]
MDATKTVLAGGRIARIDVGGSIAWTFAPDLFQAAKQIAAFPDGTIYATLEKQYVIPPLLASRASVLRIDASGPSPNPPSAVLSGDAAPSPLAPFPIIYVTPGGAAADPRAGRVYTAHSRLTVNPGSGTIDAKINVYDRALSPIAQRDHAFEFPDSGIQWAGVFVDSAGFVWAAGVEIPPSPLPRRLFVERHPPDLSAPPIVHRQTLGAAFTGDIKASLDPRGGLVVAGEQDVLGNRDNLRRVDVDGFSEMFREAGFSRGPMAVDADGSLYIGGKEPIGGLAAIVKVSSTAAHAWEPRYLTLPSDRAIEALWSPSTGTIDVAGRVPSASGATRPFISRYRQGAGGSGRLVPISAIVSTAPVDIDLTSPLVVEVRDPAGTPQGNVAVNFTISSAPKGAVRQRLTATDLQTDPLTGRARTGFKVGSIPLEYEVTSECPSCGAISSSVTFQICGKLETELYRENEDKPGKTPYIDDQLGESTSEFDKIKYSGCTLTSFAMLLNIFRTRYGLHYPESTPGTLNIALTPGGFDPKARLDLEAAVDLFTNSEIQLSSSLELGITSAQSLRKRIENSLGRGYPVILKLVSPTGRAGHYVTAVGRCGSRYMVLDPYTITNINLYDPENPPFGLALRGARIFKRGPVK